MKWLITMSNNEQFIDHQPVINSLQEYMQYVLSTPVLYVYSTGHWQDVTLHAIMTKQIISVEGLTEA